MQAPSESSHEVVAQKPDSKKYSHVNILEFQEAARDVFKLDAAIPELDLPVDISPEPVLRVWFLMMFLIS